MKRQTKRTLSCLHEAPGVNQNGGSNCKPQRVIFLPVDYRRFLKDISLFFFPAHLFHVVEGKRPLSNLVGWSQLGAAFPLGMETCVETKTPAEDTRFHAKNKKPVSICSKNCQPRGCMKTQMVSKFLVQRITRGQLSPRTGRFLRVMFGRTPLTPENTYAQIYANL